MGFADNLGIQASLAAKAAEEPPVPTVAPTVTTAADLYQQVLGRAPDEAGLKYWTDTYGSGPVTTDEVNAFKAAAAPELAAKAASPLQSVVNQWSADNPNATPQQLATAVQSAGGLTPELSSILAQKYGTTVDEINAGYNKIIQDNQYNDLVTQAYGGIGRTGVGTAANNIDQAGLDYWKGQLAAGNIKPEDFNNVFGNAVTQYEKDHPTDPYTQYVQNYQIGQQGSGIKTALSNIFQDNQISLGEANLIQQYEDKYNFTPDQIAKATGYSVDQVNNALGAKSNILGNMYKSGTLDDPFAVSNLMATQGVSAQDLSKATGGKYSADQISAFAQPFSDLNSYLTTGTAGDPTALKKAADAISADPTLAAKYGSIANAINSVEKTLDFTRAQGGFPNGTPDYVYQTFLGLNKEAVSSVPKQIDMSLFTSGSKLVGVDSDGNKIYEAIPPVGMKGYDVATDEYGNISSITKKIDDPTFNGIGQGLLANYDANGKLTGFEQPSEASRINLAPDTFLTHAAWDANGNSLANQNVHVNRGGGGLTGFISDLGPVGQIGLAIATGGLSLPEQLAANAAYQIAGGAKGSDVLKGALGTYAGAELLGTDFGKSSIGALNTIDPSGILGKAASGAVVGGTKAVFTGQDFVNSLAAGATTGGIAGVTSAVTSNVPGFSDLDKTTQKAINTGVAGLLSGKPLDQAALGAAMSYASGEAKKAYNAAKTADAGTPGGLQLASADNGVVSDAGNGILTTGTPIYAGTPGSNKVMAPAGYQLMSIDDPANDQKTIYSDPNDPFSGQYKPDGSFYDVTQNAWFKPTGELTGLAEQLNSQLQGVGLPDGYGTNVTNLDNANVTGGLSGAGNKAGTGPLSSGTPDMSTVEVTAPKDPNVPEITITAPRETDVETPSVTKPDVATPLATVTPPPTVVTPPTTVTPPLTASKPATAASPLSSAPFEDTKLSSNPQGLTSTVQRDKNILKQLHQMFGTLTPELISALEDRGIRVPKMEDVKEPSIEEELAKEKPETPQQLAEDKALETKFAATGGTIGQIDPKITYTQPALLPAAPLIDHTSRLGALRHLREGLTSRQGLAKGGLPHKYAEATPDGHKPEFITGLTGYYASGAGTGQSDDIDAILHDGDYVADADLVAALGDGSSKAGAEALEKFRRQIPHREHAEGGQPVPAKIADGEYVFPASFVTAIGKGDNKEGAKILDKMREAIRAHKRSAPTSKIPPKAKSPLDYLKMVKG